MKFIARCHKLGCKKREQHNPELSQSRNTLKEILEVGKQMMKDNKTHVYINWRVSKKMSYLIHYPTGEVTRHKLKKQIEGRE